MLTEPEACSGLEGGERGGGAAAALQTRGVRV